MRINVHSPFSSGLRPVSPIGEARLTKATRPHQIDHRKMNREKAGHRRCHGFEPVREDDGGDAQRLRQGRAPMTPSPSTWFSGDAQARPAPLALDPLLTQQPEHQRASLTTSMSAITPYIFIELQRTQIFTRRATGQSNNAGNRSSAYSGFIV